MIANNRIVFNIDGNKHKLAVHFHYQYGIARIVFGTHAEYDAYQRGDDLMEIKPIRSDADYEAARARLDGLKP